MSFTELGLSESILKAVTESGYEKPTEIQAKAIPIRIRTYSRARGPGCRTVHQLWKT